MTGFFGKVASGFAFGLGASVGHAVFGLIRLLVGIVLFVLLLLFVVRLAGGTPVDVDSFSGFFNWMMGVAGLIRDWILMLLRQFVKW